MTANMVRVLMYHRFSRAQDPRKISAAEFAKQLEYISKHFRPIHLSDVVDLAARGKPIPPRSVAITVDDGHRDFIEVAYPLLKKSRVPATVFVVSNFVFNRDWLWPDKLRYLIFASKRAEIALPLSNSVFHAKFSSSQDREQAWSDIADHCLLLDTAGRNQLILNVAWQCDVELPMTAPPEFAPAGIDELASLETDIVEIGGHTANHVILSNSSGQELVYEIDQSKKELEAALGRQTSIFCYPNGLPADISNVAVQHVEASGYRGAVTADGGLVLVSDIMRNPLRIPRMAAPNRMVEFRNEINGCSYLRMKFS